MKDMKKWLIVFICVLALVMTGCGKSDDKKDDTKKDDDKTEVVDKDSDDNTNTNDNNDNNDNTNVTDNNNNSNNNTSVTDKGNDKTEDNKGNSSVSKEEVMTCTKKSNQSGISSDIKYQVTYSNGYVKRVLSVEKVTSTDKNLLQTYKTNVENMYAEYNKLDYYDTKVTIDGDTLTSTTNIDYEKIDMNKLIEINPNSAKMLQDGKIKLEDIKSIYVQLGATCDK